MKQLFVFLLLVAAAPVLARPPDVILITVDALRADHLGAYGYASTRCASTARGKGETGPAMPIGAALTRMAAAARGFNVGSVRERDLVLVAAVAPAE